MSKMNEYCRQMDSLEFSPDFGQRTAKLMARAAKGKEDISMNRKKTLKIVIAFAAAVLLLTGSVFAVSELLSSRDVAQHLGDDDILRAFEGEDAVCLNQTAIVGNYEFTLLGITSADRLDIINDLPEENRHSYVVLAAKRTDGLPIAPEDGLLDRTGNENLSISPLVEGWMPHIVNAWSLDCAGYCLTVDGVRYYLFDYTNLELFADRTVYLAVYEGLAPSPDKLVMNEDGTISFAEGCIGEGTMFTLPVDPSRADPEAAMALLERLGWSEDDMTSDTESDDTAVSIDEELNDIIEFNGSEVLPSFSPDGSSTTSQDSYSAEIAVPTTAMLPQ